MLTSLVRVVAQAALLDPRIVLLKRATLQLPLCVLAGSAGGLRRESSDRGAVLQTRHIRSAACMTGQQARCPTDMMSAPSELSITHPTVSAERSWSDKGTAGRSQRARKDVRA